jgi:predicted ester cyclase
MNVQVSLVARPVRLVLASVNYQHRMARAQQLIDNRATDEPGSPEHNRPHARTILSRSQFAAQFVFHGPDGAELDYEGLKGYFASLRAAFDDLTISRGIIVAEGAFVACQTTMAGTFVREFTHSPVGPLPPNGNRVVFELMNIFRYDGQGRLAEEWVQTDNRSRLRQLGAEGR